MSEKIEKIIKEKFEQADTPLKKVGVAVAVVAAGPAVIAGIAGEKGVQGAKAAAKKIKEENINAQFKKYNPVFRDQYNASDFSLPNMVMIVDDSERRDIEVCKGSIGWKSVEDGMEVLHLYYDAVATSGLVFSPAPMCNSIYYVDPHKTTSFVNLDSLFERMQREKLAELVDVANCLGAKSYSVEIIEEEKQTEQGVVNAKAEAKVKIAKAGAGVEHKDDSLKHGVRRASVTANFSEKREPIEPTLCWFKDDDSILGLIKHVCRDHGRIKGQTLIFEGSKHAVMAQETAAKIDAAVKKLGAQVSGTMVKKAESESSSKIIFKLKF